MTICAFVVELEYIDVWMWSYHIIFVLLVSALLICSHSSCSLYQSYNLRLSYKRLKVIPYHFYFQKVLMISEPQQLPWECPLRQLYLGFWYQQTSLWVCYQVDSNESSNDFRTSTIALRMPSASALFGFLIPANLVMGLLSSR